jgi:serine/threonine protein kinase/Tol biopolymer transport system component
MNSERWERVAHLYQEALERDPSERDVFLKDASGDDPDLRREVASLLAQDDAVGPLDRPMLTAAADVLEPEAELAAGSRLGPYEIVQLLGVGGMGQVYRARDTKLGRSVALKLLPPDLEADADRLTRFQREARFLASLNHPHIAAIYGIEDGQLSVPAGGEAAAHVHALILELVEGPTLADRIAQGPIPVSEALPIARQIADALEAAHESGIIHRDLKPANIKIRPDGTVKVLDFGLAKALDSSASSELGLTQSNLLSSRTTSAGLILGTAAYMSPEQAAARPVDKRADIWSFGAVLWEMLTGRRLFSGETLSHTLADVLRADIDCTHVPAGTPQVIRDLIRRCLDRDVRRRLRDIGEARIAIDRAILDSSEIVIGTARRVEGRRHPQLARALPWAISVATSVLAVALVVVSAPWRPRIGVQPIRVNVRLGSDVSVANVLPLSAHLALSPQGDVLAFVGQKAGGTRQLYVRRLDQWQTVPLAGTDNGTDPFFSPDGRWIGFFADGKLKKMAVTGGAAVALCDVAGAAGGTWSEDGTIVFAQMFSDAPLMRVSDAGGTPEPLTRLADGERFQRWPQTLMGGKAVLFTSGRSSPLASGSYDVVAQQLPNGPRKVLQTGSYFARYVSGHLLYLHDRTMFAAAFDVGRLELTGKPVPVLQQVTSSSAAGSGQLAVSENGTVVYLESADASEEAAPLVWIDRDGQTSPLRSTPAEWGNPRFSPDGTRLALDITPSGGRPAVWIYDWTRDQLTRLTSGDGADVSPVWTPDGRRIVFASTRGNGVPNLYWQRVDGTGNVQRLTDSNRTHIAASFHKSGKFLAFSEASSPSNLMVLPIDGDEASGWKPGTPTVFQKDALGPMFSPDGRWIAYSTNETGRAEVFVRRFASAGAKWPVSTNGGRLPRWSQARHELLFTDPSFHIMAAGYAVEGNSLRVDKPHLWSPARFRVLSTRQDYDLHPDGNRVVSAGLQQNPVGTEPNHVSMILNFFDELRRIAPASRQ